MRIAVVLAVFMAFGAGCGPGDDYDKRADRERALKNIEEQTERLRMLTDPKFASTEQGTYDRAMALKDRGALLESSIVLKDLVKKFPKSPLAAEANRIIAENTAKQKEVEPIADISASPDRRGGLIPNEAPLLRSSEKPIAFGMAMALIVGGLAAYFLPTIIASTRGHVNANAIFATNFLLGWTFLGWVVAFIWSLTANVRRAE